YAGTLGPAVLVLLIACVNVGCMLLARGVARDKELTVRRALGATRANVIRLLLEENLVLALISGTIGGGLAVAILRGLAALFAEIASAVGLIVWTAMLYTLFSQIGSIKLAFPADRVVAMRVPAPDVRRIAERVGAVPGVTAVTISSGLLGGGARIRVETDGA